MCGGRRGGGAVERAERGGATIALATEMRRPKRAGLGLELHRRLNLALDRRDALARRERRRRVARRLLSRGKAAANGRPRRP